MYYIDPYVPFLKSDDVLINPEKQYAIPLSIEYEQPDEMDDSSIPAAFSRLLAAEEAEANEIDSNERFLEYRPQKFIAEESTMSTENFNFFNQFICIFSF